MILGLAAAVLGGGCAAQGRGASALLSDPGAGKGLTRSLAVVAVPGPGAPASVVQATATCPGGSLLVGGGVSTMLRGGALPPSSLHANGTFPVADGRGWEADGATGGQMVLGGVTTGFALCASGGPVSTTVVAADVAGPAAARAVAHATAACPQGTVLTGGGGVTGSPEGGGGSPSLHLIGSFPSTPAGDPLAAGQRPMAWTARAGAGGRGGAGLHTSAYAICGLWPGHSTQVAASRLPGPLNPGGSRAVVAACPPGSTLLGGGALTGPGDGGQPQQGLHLTGSLPASGVGWPDTGSTPSPGSRSGPASGPRSGSSSGSRSGSSSGSRSGSSSGSLSGAWTARAEAGGQGSPPGTGTTAFAVCAL